MSQILHHYLKLKFNRHPIFLFAKSGNPTQSIEITTNPLTLLHHGVNFPTKF